jgi:putative Holliday junction resolvase
MQFAEALRAVVSVPVVEWDERLTSVQAERSLNAMDVRGARRKELVDQMAAAIILQAYLDSLGSEEGMDAP